jgi:hypothetical protein
MKPKKENGIAMSFPLSSKVGRCHEEFPNNATFVVGLSKVTKKTA